MERTVEGMRPRRLRWGLTGLEAIDQRLGILLSTPKGSQTLDREFGIDLSLLDRPNNWARAMAQQDIVSAIRRYEPMVRVRNVTFRESVGDILDGRMVPVITYSVGW